MKTPMHMTILSLCNQNHQSGREEALVANPDHIFGCDLDDNAFELTPEQISDGDPNLPRQLFLPYFVFYLTNHFVDVNDTIV